MRRKVLLVESDSVLLEQYYQGLNDGYEVKSALTAQEAIDVLDHHGGSIDMIVLDFQLGTNNGVEFLHEIRSYDDWSAIPAIVLSTVPENRIDTTRLNSYGVHRLLYKPHTSPKELLLQVSRALS